MIERVIENWLTSVNERQYQLPFCQLLAGAGEEVVYISSHGPYEQGKDVITLTNSGPRAYQLKTGDINLADWRKIKGEIEELVEYPIQHPAVRTTRAHQPFLVTNGELKDTVLQAIHALNRSWKRRGYRGLEIITKGTLLQRFVELHGTFLPREPKEFQSFLTLLLEAGDEPLDKARFSAFVESILPFDEKTVTKHTLQRAIASTLLLTSYILKSAEVRENHWAQFEAWTIVGAYVLGIAEKFHLSARYWDASFGLCKLGIENALVGLTRECNESRDFVEGNALTDGYFFHERATIIAGLLSAHMLSHSIERTAADADPAMAVIKRAVKHIGVWGESAVPFVVCLALQLEGHDPAVAENLIFKTLKDIVTANGGSEDRGIPDPYHGPEECVRFRLNFEDNTEKFHGQSYAAEALVDFLARRLRRQALASIWYEITDISLVHVRPATAWDWYRWDSDSAQLNERLPRRPESWALLLREARECETSEVPPLLRTHVWFIPYFLLVYPHRFQSSILKVMEDALVM